MCHGDAGGDIGVEEQLLNGDHIRFQLADQLLHVATDLVQAAAEGQTRRSGNGAVRHHVDLCPFRLHQAEADGGKAGVDA